MALTLKRSGWQSSPSVLPGGDDPSDSDLTAYAAWRDALLLSVNDAIENLSDWRVDPLSVLPAIRPAEFDRHLLYATAGDMPVEKWSADVCLRRLAGLFSARPGLLQPIAARYLNDETAAYCREIR